jgi:hypothetical protein
MTFSDKCYDAERDCIREECAWWVMQQARERLAAWEAACWSRDWIVDNYKDMQERTCRRLREFVVYRDGSTGEYRVVCSACGWALRAKGVYRYCPNCGARVTGD